MKKYCVIIVVTSLLIASCSTIPKKRHPQSPDDYTISNGIRVPVRIAADQIGVLKQEDADEKKLIAFAHSRNLEMVDQFPGGIYIFQLNQALSRTALLTTVQDIRKEGSALLSQAGLVARTEDSKAPMLITDELIIQFKAETRPKEIESFFARDKNLRIITQNIFEKRQYLVKLRQETNRDALVYSNQLSEEQLIEFAHPNYVLVVDYRETVPNDTLFNNQWPHRNTGQGGGTVDADVDTSWAWDINQGVNGTVIAVIDTGYDTGHLDLTPNLWTNPGEIAGDGIDNDGNGFVDDINGWDFRGNDNTLAGGNHGTGVAGVAAARGGNNRGVSGSCPNCGIMLIRNGNTAFTQAQGFGYAQQMGANIITNSWGYRVGTAIPANVSTAINNAAGAGSVIFFAMNNGNRNDCIGATPDISSLANVIAVSAVSNQDRKVTESAFGNCMDLVASTHRGYGPNLNGFPAGSGVAYTGTLNVPSTDLRNNAGYNNANPENNANGFDPTYCPGQTANRNYTLCFGGTSAATPLAAGVAGLALSANNALTRIQIQRLLQDTADKVEDSAAGYAEATGFSSAGGVASHGYGRVNAFEAVRVVAPAAQGGRGGVDIFIRDNRLDWGNTEQRSNVLMEPTRGFIPHYQSVDIKVDHPPYQAAPTTSTQFDAFVHENPVSGAVNKVYVRVHNRGPSTANTVNIKLHWAFAGTALPGLPADFWTTFPGDSAAVGSPWTSLGLRTVNNLGYSGSSVGGTGADASQIVSYDFTGPPLDPSVPAFRHYCLFAVIDSDQDRVSAASRARLVPDFITPRDNNVTHRNVSLEDPATGGRFSAAFFVRNPYLEKLKTRLLLKAPEGWEVNIEPLAFGQAISLEANEEVLVHITYEVHGKEKEGAIEVFQEEILDDQPQILGGMTFQVAKPKAPDHEDCIVYNPDKLHVIHEGATGWLLTDGKMRMLKLSNEADASRALRLAKQHHYQCFIGRDNTRSNRKDYIVQYWK